LSFVSTSAVARPPTGRLYPTGNSAHVSGRPWYPWAFPRAFASWAIPPCRLLCAPLLPGRERVGRVTSFRRSICRCTGEVPISTGPAGWCRVSVKGLTHPLQRRTVTFVAGLRLLSSAVRPGFRYDGCRGSLGYSCATVLAVTSIRLRGVRRLASAPPRPGALGRAEVRLCGRG
jgi:hypothetical protein